MSTLEQIDKEIAAQSVKEQDLIRRIDETLRPRSCFSSMEDYGSDDPFETGIDYLAQELERLGFVQSNGQQST